MYYIGIDFGGTNIAAGIVDENFQHCTQGQHTYKRRQTVGRNYRRYGDDFKPHDEARRH